MEIDLSQLPDDLAARQGYETLFRLWKRLHELAAVGRYLRNQEFDIWTRDVRSNLMTHELNFFDKPLKPAGAARNLEWQQTRLNARLKELLKGRHGFKGSGG